MERWERRAKKLAKRRGQMLVSGAGLKKIHLPLIGHKAKEAESRATPRGRKKRKRR